MTIDDSLSYQKFCSCPLDSCAKVVSQPVDVCVPVEVRPNVIVGEVCTSCQGAPTVTCQCSDCRTHCIIKITQQVCLTIPVRFGVTACTGDPGISCADRLCDCD